MREHIKVTKVANKITGVTVSEAGDPPPDPTGTTGL